MGAKGKPPTCSRQLVKEQHTQTRAYLPRAQKAAKLQRATGHKHVAVPLSAPPHAASYRRAGAEKRAQRSRWLLTPSVMITREVLKN